MKWKSLLICLIMLLLGGTVYYAHALYTFLGGIQDPQIVQNQTAGKPAGEPADRIPVWGGKDRVNILLLGVDRREVRPDEMPRSDTMILVSIDPVDKTYEMFSILRDTYVTIPDHGRSRINTALSIGGPELAMQTVSEFTGLPVSRYVITDFEGFKNVIDAVGGVEIEVEKNMRYRDPADQGKYDINLKKGVQRLNGDKALQYVRFRHDALSDYTRTERQRKLLKALSVQLKQGKTLLQLPKILESVRPYVQTNLSSIDILKLAALSFSLKDDQAGQHQIPPMGMFREANRGGAVLVPAEEEVRAYIQEQMHKGGSPQPAVSVP